MRDTIKVALWEVCDRVFCAAEQILFLFCSLEASFKPPGFTQVQITNRPINQYDLGFCFVFFCLFFVFCFFHLGEEWLLNT